MEALKKKMVSRGLYLLWALGIVILAYVPARDDFIMLLVNYLVVFVIYWFIIDPKNRIRLKSLLLVAVVTRLLLIPATPKLSDDVYRYIWDGQLVVSMENPYGNTPSEWMKEGDKKLPHFLDEELYPHLNSVYYHSVYPPLTQIVFTTGTAIARGHSGGAAFWTKALVVMAEITLLFIIVPLLRRLGKDPGMVAIYAFNPLVLIEISGNLHLEGMSIIFIALALMYYRGKKGIRSGVMMGLAAGIKIIPIILLPVMIVAKGFKQWLSFLLSATITTILVFLPLLFKESIANYLESIQLYFQSFEFNASIYYLLRYLGYQIKGYNWIEVMGPLSFVLFLLCYATFLLFIYQRKLEQIRMANALLITYTLFLLFQTTVHPWYILPLVFLASITGWRFPIIWSGSIFLSYHVYSTSAGQENLWITFLSYFLVIVGALLWDRQKILELWKKEPLKSVDNSAE